MKTMSDIELSGKKVLMRIDTDIEISGELIKEDYRLEKTLPDIEKVLSQAEKLYLVGHLGRPARHVPMSIGAGVAGGPGEGEREFTLLPVAKKLSQLLGFENENFSLWQTPQGFGVFRLSSKLFLLENIRFYKGEETNNADFAKKLASLADVYINDAVATLHRAHASVVGVTKYLPSCFGLLTAREIEKIEKLLSNPNRPFVVIVGGAKVEDKKPMVNNLVKIADKVLVGGEIANELIDQNYKNEKVILPVDFVDHGRFDIGLKSTEQFIREIGQAKTIFWNGSLGKTEDVKYQAGSEQVAKAIVNNEVAEKIVAGGDTVAFISQLGLYDKFNYVCSGGGAVLELLAGKKLPGIEAIEKAKN